MKANKQFASKQASPPHISVIIPVYNRQMMAVEAVRSVLFQSYPYIECILVDDGSSEPPEEACSMFAADPRFRCLRIEHTGMPGAARNRGVEDARFDLIAFLDSDDIWLPEKLERQIPLLSGGSESVAAAPRTLPPLIHTREIWLRGTKIISQKTQRHRRRGDVFEDALGKCMIGPSTVLMRREVFEELGGFREDLEIAEDYEFWLRLTARYEVEYIDTPLVVKRAGHGEQLSEKYGQIEIFRIRGLHDLVRSGWLAEGRRRMPTETGRAAPAGMLQELAAAELARKAAIYAAGCRKRGRPEEAERYEKLAREFSGGPAGG
ncbi:MAG: glycosyltransferase family A protein [Spirochaetota bacterium]|nr:glycosyltransferase family A protein [Spirochaetota bacterium]